MIPSAIEGQVRTITGGIEAILGDDLVGSYLHGSAVLGCFGPWSDIDVLAVSRRALTPEQRPRLVRLLLSASGPYERAGPLRPVELDVVAVLALERWRHPAPFEFHYSESLRPRFEAGDDEPWESTESRDLAAHVAMLRASGVALSGPAAHELFPQIPEADFRDALLYDVEWWQGHLAELTAIPGGIRNAVLSLARIWATLTTAEMHSKATGVEWALPRLPAELRQVLEHAARIYRGAEHEARWDELPVEDYVRFVSAEIERT